MTTFATPSERPRNAEEWFRSLGFTLPLAEYAAAMPPATS